MSQSIESTALCERCHLLSFDDFAIGGREVIDEDGNARLSFHHDMIELRPEWYSELPNDALDDPDYTLVRLEWHLDDSLPDMPHLTRSSQSGCSFCNTLRCSLVESLAQEAKYYSIEDGLLTLVAYLSLFESGGVEGLLVEGTFNQTQGTDKVIQILFPIEAAPSKFQHVTAYELVEPNALLTVVRSG